MIMTPNATTYAGAIPTIMWDMLHVCNLRCSYCYSTYFGDFETTVPQIDTLLRTYEEFERELGYYTRINITGGEPLLIRPLEQIISVLKKRKYKVTIDTNGTLLTPERARALSDSGTDGVRISLDSADETINDSRRGKHRTVMTNIKRVLNIKDALGFRIGINAVIGHWNVDSIGEFFRWCIDNGVDYFTFNLVWEGEKNDIYNIGQRLCDGIMKFLNLVNEKRNMIQIPSPQYLGLVEAVLKKDVSEQSVATCQMGKTFFFVTSNGQVLRTLQGSHENEESYTICGTSFPLCLTIRCMGLWELFYGGL